ncbi:TPA: hypothetical protein ACRGPL_005492, partial [Klebsiella pneumoniae]
MWQINEVVLFDNDPYRILAIEDGQVVWMQISADKGVPQARAELLLMQYLDEGRLVRTDDPYVHPRFYVSTSKSIIKALINMHSF